MMIHLPKDVESSINAEILSGHFASVDEAIAAAWRAFRRQAQQDQPEVTGPSASEGQSVSTDKPIWEEILELTADIPDEEWDKLPTDLAEQHDHYIYGTPKRPAS